ncbi:MAG: efflux RND transporter permease subunit, partial [bacterium]|nr:efflux RND transporter permease subunit [bacterium]
MKSIVAWFAENRVAANLLMFMLVIGGAMALFRIPQKPFPDIDVDIVTVAVEYRGAAPEEVEEGVCVRIEEEIDSVDGIDKIRSTAVEGSCAVFVEVMQGADAKVVLDDVKTRVDAISTFPDETEKPVISRVTLRRPVIDVVISGETDERSMKELGQRLRDEVNAIPGITQTSLSSIRPYEISIEVPEESLRRFGISFDQVVQAVRSSSLDLPGGSIKTRGGEILLRTKGQAYTGADFENVVVLTRRDGTRVTIADVGRVIDGFEDIDQFSSFDGESAVTLSIFRVGDQDV